VGREPPAVVETGSRMGTLTVTTSPRTDVYLDGEFVARSPFSARSVPAGAHRLRLANEAAGIDHEEPVRIASGGLTTILRTADQLGTTTRPSSSRDAGAAAPGPRDAGRASDGIRIRTDVYRRDAE